MFMKLISSKFLKYNMRFFADYTKTYTSKISGPQKLDKARLSEFFKAVHPDLLSTAPPEYQTLNSKSMQDLNSYINLLEQNAGVQYTKLEFYVKMKSDSEMGDNFVKRSVELLPIKAQANSDLLKMHIKNVIEILNSMIKEDAQKTVKMGAMPDHLIQPAKVAKIEVFFKSRKIIGRITKYER